MKFILLRQDLKCGISANGVQGFEMADRERCSLLSRTLAELIIETLSEAQDEVA